MSTNPQTSFGEGVARRFERAAAEAQRQIALLGGGAREAAFLERIADELREAAADVAGILASDWRTSAAEVDARIDHLLGNKNLSRYGVDPFGFSPEYVKPIIPLVEFLYRVWFRCEVHGIEHVPEGRAFLISNHTGQLPFDGAMIGTSLLLEREPPVMIRAMVEKLAIAAPFFGTFAMRCGQVTGLPENCRALLERDESVLVFPEGSRGIAKPFRDRYQLTQFGLGFMRLALEAGAPIVPIAVVGAEEQIINMGNIEPLARLFNLPSFPLAPLALLLGPAAMLPMPVKYRIYFGEPMRFDGDPNDDDAVIAQKVAKVRAAIEKMIAHGLAERRGYFV